MRRVLFVVAALAISPASAQVFRCDVGGRTVFSDIPCEPGAKTHAVRPASGASNAEDAARRIEETRQAKSRFEREDRERKLNSDLAAIERESERRAEALRCDRLREDRKRAERLSKEYRYKKNIERAEAEAKELESREFFDCR